MCVLGCCKAAAIALCLAVLAVVGFLIVLAGRFWAAGQDYIAKHPHSWTYAGMFESDDFWDLSIGKYWETGGWWLLVVVVAVLLTILVVWAVMWLCRILCGCYVCDCLAWCADRSSPGAKEWRRSHVRRDMMIEETHTFDGLDDSDDDDNEEDACEMGLSMDIPMRKLNLTKEEKRRLAEERERALTGKTLGDFVLPTDSSFSSTSPAIDEQ